MNTRNRLFLITFISLLRSRLTSLSSDTAVHANEIRRGDRPSKPGFKVYCIRYQMQRHLQTSNITSDIHLYFSYDGSILSKTHK